jgi:hypothetical protein
MLKKVYFVCIVIFIVLIGCKSNSSDCFKQIGQIDSINYVFKNSPQNINIYDIFDVILIQDSVFSIKIVTNKTLLDNINVEMNDTALEIKDLNKCYFLRNKNIKHKLYIHAPDLKEMLIMGVVNLITPDTINFTRFLIRVYSEVSFCNININCSEHFFFELWRVTGDFKISGKSTYFAILNHGQAYIDASNFQSNYVYIEQRSSGDIKISVSDFLSANIFDIGNVYYIGNPILKVSEYCKGKAIKLN